MPGQRAFDTREFSRNATTTVPENYAPMWKRRKQERICLSEGNARNAVRETRLSGTSAIIEVTYNESRLFHCALLLCTK